MTWDWLKEIPFWQKLMSPFVGVFATVYAWAKIKSKLWLEFNEAKHCYVSSNDDFKDGAGPVLRKFIRLIVHNDGLQSVKGCRVFLERIEEVTTDGLKPVNYPTPLRLLWAKEGSGKIDSVRTISKGQDIVDIIRTDHFDSGDRILICDIEYTSILDFKRRYRLTVVARADDVPACELQLDVFFGSSWDSLQVLEPRSVVIKSRRK